jgi:hypothetical protein
MGRLSIEMKALRNTSAGMVARSELIGLCATWFGPLVLYTHVLVSYLLRQSCDELACYVQNPSR